MADKKFPGLAKAQRNNGQTLVWRFGAQTSGMNPSPFPAPKIIDIA